MGRMGHTGRPASLRAPSSPREQLLLDLVADVARHAGYVRHTRGLAVRVGCSKGVQAELSAIEARLSALHLVVLIAGGWCPHAPASLPILA